MPSAWKNTSFSTQGSYRLDLFFDNVSIYILQNGNELVKFQLVYMLFPLYSVLLMYVKMGVFDVITLENRFVFLIRVDEML